MKKPAASNNESSTFSLADLMNKKSVRTTFKISREAIEALEWLVESSETAFKEVLNVLSVLLENDFPLNQSNPEEGTFSERIIRETKNEVMTKKKVMIRKTFVISQGSLRILQKFSKDNGISRDALLECLILDFVRSAKTHHEERSKKYETARKMVKNLSDETEKKWQKLQELLGEGDPIVLEVVNAGSHLQNLLDAIDGYLQNGTPIKTGLEY